LPHLNFWTKIGLQTMKYWIGLGSNLGNREENLREALLALKRKKISLITLSAVYETEPLDFRDQPVFLNMAVEIETSQFPRALLRTCKFIEREMGRRPASSNHPRIIDLDILLAENRVLSLPDLTIPHPRMHKRRFVLEPLREIAPEIIHPVYKKTIRQLEKECQDTSLVRKFGYLKIPSS